MLMSHSAELTGKAVLITGAAGCIGAWVVKQLRELGAIPVVFDIAENRERLDLIMPDAETVIWDCLLYTSPSPRDYAASRMPSSA